LREQVLELLCLQGFYWSALPTLAHVVVAHLEHVYAMKQRGPGIYAGCRVLFSIALIYVLLWP
jgi:hypothetical protein